MAMTVMAHRIVMGVVWLTLVRASAVAFAALELACVVASFIFRRYWRVYRSFFPPLYR